MTDTQIIKQLENQLNIKLKKVEEIDWDTVGYTTDQQENITGLGLYRCKIKDVTPIIKQLTDLKNLTNLNLGYNQISDISALKDLKELTRLYLSSNQISDISALKNLTTVLSILEIRLI